MAEESGQERTEAPTPKRLEDARKKGQVPRSRDFNTLVSLLAGGVAAYALGPHLVDNTTEMMRRGLQLDRGSLFRDSSTVTGLAEAGEYALGGLAPLLVVMFVVAILAPLMLGGWTFSAKALAPKMERISPLKGLQRIFGAQGLVELGKAILKFLLVSAVAVVVLWQTVDWLVLLGLSPLGLSLPAAGNKLITSFLLLSSAMIVIALIDVPFQLWQHTRKLRMTRQEIRDEMKDSEGRPEIKSHVRGLQQEAANKRMLQDVPDADVVITNPTHYAVALKYTDGEMNAPIMVAKGVDLMAARIREIATENGVTIFEAPPLARALHASTEPGQQIPEDLFVAVARVLAYVFQLRRAPGKRIPRPEASSLVPASYEEKVNRHG